MATETVTQTKVKLGKKEKLTPENVRYMAACTDIANALIQEYESNLDSSKPKKDINLNRLRGDVSKKHRLSNQPPLTAILSAVPENYKKHLMAKLMAKPVRSASGIAVVACMSKPHRCPVSDPIPRAPKELFAPLTDSPDPAHCLHRKCVCLLSRRARFGL